MDKGQYLGHIEKGINRLSYRETLVETTVKKPEYIELLLDLMGETQLKESNHAARLLELVIKQNRLLILPYLDRFCSILARLTQDASIRAAAKLIEICCFEFYVKENPLFYRNLNEEHLKSFTEVTFDWMIQDKSIAIQAHSMYSLYLMGLQFKWIHSELTLHIDRKLPYGSEGFQNRGKKILSAIETNKLLKLY